MKSDAERKAEIKSYYSQELLDGAKKINMSKVGNDIWKMMQHENRGDFMYESPITNYISEIIDKQMVERENVILATVSEKIGIDVNREELIKALNYDRQQYEKGYADAKAEYEPKWTKVKDGLPKPQKYGDADFSDWLFTAIRTYDGFENIAYHMAHYCFSLKAWYTKGFISGEVVAWMPIQKYEGVE